MPKKHSLRKFIFFKFKIITKLQQIIYPCPSLFCFLFLNFILNNNKYLFSKNKIKKIEKNVAVIWFKKKNRWNNILFLWKKTTLLKKYNNKLIIIFPLLLPLGLNKACTGSVQASLPTSHQVSSSSFFNHRFSFLFLTFILNNKYLLSKRRKYGCYMIFF